VPLVVAEFDRLQGAEMGMKRELIANMLGISPERALQGAHTLQNPGLVNYTEGRIRVLDRGGLEERTYEGLRRRPERIRPTVAR
jgi:hypothetical protein